MNRKALFLVAMTVFVLACGGTAPRKLELYPTPTVDPTQTPIFVVWTGTPDVTYTPIVVVVTQTPRVAELCVNVEAVYLRPAPNTVNYPVAPVPNGEKVRDLGGRDGAWAFVALGSKQGWIKLEYLGTCP